MRPSTNGRASRFTAAEIADVREVYRLLRLAERQRTQIQQRLGMSPDEFNNYGRGARGKKPRKEAA